jgi:hypothetical protein
MSDNQQKPATYALREATQTTHGQWHTGEPQFATTLTLFSTVERGSLLYNTATARVITTWLYRSQCFERSDPSRCMADSQPKTSLPSALMVPSCRHRYSLGTDKRDGLVLHPPRVGVPQRCVHAALGCEKGPDRLQFITHQYLAVPKCTRLARSGSAVDQQFWVSSFHWLNIAFSKTAEHHEGLKVGSSCSTQHEA